jgi:hypothetical protein
VVSVTPAQGATNVPINTTVTATFSTAMNPATISTSTFTVTNPSGVAVAGAVVYSGVTATFTPADDLAYNTTYTATITNGAATSGGANLLGNFVWTFTTIAGASPVPTVVSVVPANGAVSVPVSQVLSATFSEAMNPANISATTFTVSANGVAVPGTVTYSGEVATFTPSASLANSTVYTATITTGATSEAGIPLAANYVWSFTTIAPTPAVTAVVPANKAASVPIAQALTVAFSEAMSPNTLSAATFTVTGPGGVAVSGAVTYSGLVATFTPSANLAHSTSYVATITTGATSVAGIPLAANYVWTFTTISPTPTVTTVIPANGAVNVPVSQVLSATFSEAMNPANISATTFTVSANGAAVPGTVAYSGLAATFTPSASLANSTVYTATITTGATSVAGIPLAANYVWSFTTITPAPTVTAVAPANGATSVPIAQALTATFSEAMSPGTLDAATFTVTGPSGVAVSGAVTYSGLVATFTPAANLAYNTSYVATITTGAEDLAGTGLVTNYVWTFTTISQVLSVTSTVPVNTATGVPADQVLSATFSSPMECPAFPAAAFTVTGPNTTAVPGTIGCSGSVATFTPAANLAFNTLFTATITTGAQNLTGASLSSNYVWTFLTVPAPTPPTVISTVPINEATAVPTNQALSAAFSEAMTSTSINSGTFLLTVKGGASVSGVVTYVAAGSIATFTPDASLEPDTVYTATITTGANDLNGTALAQNYVWSFTTAALPIVTPPTVTSTIPAGLTLDVPFNQIVSATFSKAMDPATINSGTFTLTGPGATAVSGLVAYASVGNTLTFTPTANLAADTTFTATITTGAQDLAGIGLVNDYVWTFTTGTTPVVDSPELVSTVPLNAATDVALNQAVSATFTKAMNPLTLTTATFLLYQGTSASGTPIPATITYDAINFIATLTPTDQLTASTTYTATVTDGATDMAGNPLGTTGASNPWSFTTGTAAVQPPVVLGSTIALFGGFGGSAGMTNSGISTVVNNGDIGTTGASTTVTGFHDETVLPVDSSAGSTTGCTYTEVVNADIGLVTGEIYTNTPPPTSGCPNEGTTATMAIATEALSEAQTAYTTLQSSTASVAPGSATQGTTLANTELGSTTLYPDVYYSATTVGITSGDLTLDAQGDSNAYWVFQVGTALTVGAAANPRSVILTNGAQASHIYWVCGSAATINGAGGGTFEGTVITSSGGISVSTAGVTTITTINGRLIAMGASTTLVNTVINVP